VVGGLLAVGLLARGGAVPRRPVAVAAFADEEGLELLMVKVVVGSERVFVVACPG